MCTEGGGGSKGRQALSLPPPRLCSAPNNHRGAYSLPKPFPRSPFGECAGGVAPTPSLPPPRPPPTSGGSRAERGEQAPICPQPTLLKQRLCSRFDKRAHSHFKGTFLSPSSMQSPLNCVFKNLC